MFVEFCVAIIVFVAGYFLGLVRKIEINIDYTNNDTNQTFAATRFDLQQKSNFNTDSEEIKRPIEIDERKFITAIDTEDFEKNFEELGDKTVSQDNITNSVSKLSGLKGKNNQ
jgi:hypothetical protein